MNLQEVIDYFSTPEHDSHDACQLFLAYLKAPKEIREKVFYALRDSREDVKQGKLNELVEGSPCWTSPDHMIEMIYEGTKARSLSSGGAWIMMDLGNMAKKEIANG